jgi:hypothetical protein
VDARALSAIRCADEQCFCGRRSRVVLTPRRWRQVGDDARASRRRWWQQSPVTKESAEETVKTIAQEMPGVSGGPVATNSCAYYFAHGAAGASRARHFPRPLNLRGQRLSQLGRIAPRECEGVTWIDVIARSACDEAIHLCGRAMDCFAEPVIGRAFARPVGSQ